MTRPPDSDLFTQKFWGSLSVRGPAGGEADHSGSETCVWTRNVPSMSGGPIGGLQNSKKRKRRGPLRSKKGRTDQYEYFITNNTK